MRNLLCIFTIALLCTVTFTGQSADIPQKDEPLIPQPPQIDIPPRELSPRQPVIEKQKPKFEVGVSVTCDDENTKAFIESHIKRELRSLQDVEIVDVGKYELSIVAIETKASGRKTGNIAVASMCLRQYNSDTILNKLMDAYPVNTKGYNELRDSGVILDLMLIYDKTKLILNTGMREDLDEICKEIVVDFDTQMLEPDRK